MIRSPAAIVRASLVEHAIVSAGDTVLVAVSGGPDSLCLLHILYSLREDLGIALHVAHLDHMLRGDESAAEAEFVATTARVWGLSITATALDVRALAQSNHENLHQAARAARYRFLAQAARACGARAVAVAHHADDQAETVLMHLLRGAGPAGLRGMRPTVPWEEWVPEHETRRSGDAKRNELSLSSIPPVSPALIRPLLQVTRAEIEAYCAAHSLQPRRDPTNLDPSATRNRIRHELLPRLIEYNSHIVAALGRTAALSADEHDLIQRSLTAVWPSLAYQRPGAIDFDGAAWRGLHPALQREALRRAYTLWGGSATLEWEHVEAARAVVAGGVGGRAELPGGVALTVGYGGAFTIGVPHEHSGPQLAGHALALAIPGRVALAAGWAIEAIQRPAPAAPATELQVDLDADAIVGPLLVRSRQPGDRFRPAGARGRRRIQDMFVDAKVPRALRAAWPVVTVPAGIVWTPGLRPAADFAPSATTQRVVRLRVIGPENI
jgi:tRNA(Ile)-lysidine synthetase-like protein